MIDLVGQLILLIGFAAVLVFFAVVWRAHLSYVRWQDARSRRELTYAVLLFMAIFSAIASIAIVRALPPRHPIGVIFVGVPWGSILMAGLVMLRISLRRREP